MSQKYDRNEIWKLPENWGSNGKNFRLTLFERKINHISNSHIISEIILYFTPTHEHV